MSKRTIQLSIFAAFRRIHGHLLIPPRFVVPVDKKWPQEYQEFNLAKHVKDIIAQQDDEKLKYFETSEIDYFVNYLGFSRGGKQGYASYHHLVGFEKFKEIYFHNNIPPEFVIPHLDRWPKVIWGVKLGLVLSNIQKFGDHKTIQSDLRRLGFLAESNEDTMPEELTKLFEAIELYKSINNNVKITEDYVIENNSTDYPQHLWEFPLGPLLHSVKLRMKYNNFNLSSKFKKLGVTLSVAQTKSSPEKVILEAVSVYKLLNGHVSVPVDFVIKQDLQYPSHLWGHKLGKVLANARKGSHRKLHDKLRDIGVDIPFYAPKEKKSIKKTKSVLATCLD